MSNGARGVVLAGVYAGECIPAHVCAPRRVLLIGHPYACWRQFSFFLGRDRVRSPWRWLAWALCALSNDISGECVRGFGWACRGVRRAARYTRKHWRGMAETGLFATCVVASAGLCIAGDAVVYGAEYYAKSKKYGYKSRRSWGAPLVNFGLNTTGAGLGKGLHHIYTKKVGPRGYRWGRTLFRRKPVKRPHWSIFKFNVGIGAAFFGLGSSIRW